MWVQRNTLALEKMKSEIKHIHDIYKAHDGVA